MEEIIDEKDIEIVHQIVYRFTYEEYDFYIEYNIEEDEWSASSFDEEKYDERIILDEVNDNILLFDQYNLTIDELNDLKEFVNKDLVNKGTNNI